MPEPLKNVYSPAFVEQFLNSWKKVTPALSDEKFHAYVFDNGWELLELKARMSRLAEAMQLVLPSSFKEATPVLKRLVKQLIDDGFSKDNFEFMFIPEYVERQGINNLEEALDVFESITQFTSCEFAIRPFIMQNETRVMKQMLQWSKHHHPSVRRFSSEGCRPRLPWAMALPRFKKDPSLILPILEQLKADSSLFVRKSVANNLNDISKDQPELALNIAYNWYGQQSTTDWIVKHGARSLLKAGNPRAMELFGYAPIDQLVLNDFALITEEVIFGEQLAFHFSLQNKTNKELKVRMEYGIYFLKNNGTQAKKVFKISERTLSPNEKVVLEKQHKITPISTRKYYEGEHAVALIINGIEFSKKPFLLNM